MLKIMKYIQYCFCSILFLCVFVGCKTNETNYRAAYELAKGSAQDGEMLGLIEKKSVPQLTTIGDVQVDLRKEYVAVTVDGGGTKEMLKRYNVVIGRYRQVFNARSMRARMEALGYDAFVIENREPSYFVVAGASDEINEAIKILQSVAENDKIVIKSPFPWVLEPAQYLKKQQR